MQCLAECEEWLQVEEIEWKNFKEFATIISIERSKKQHRFFIILVVLFKLSGRKLHKKDKF